MSFSDRPDGGPRAESQYEYFNKNTQSRCVVCNKPFMYYPIKEEVRLDSQGNFVHIGCI